MLGDLNTKREREKVVVADLRLVERTMFAEKRTRRRGERLMSEHAGRGSWCNADSIAMETNGGKAQARRRGLRRKRSLLCTVGVWGGG